jgi:hypothetical protein
MAQFYDCISLNFPVGRTQISVSFLCLHSEGDPSFSALVRYYQPSDQGRRVVACNGAGSVHARDEEISHLRDQCIDGRAIWRNDMDWVNLYQDCDQ